MGSANDYNFVNVRHQGFQINDQDVDSSDSDVQYYGYSNSEGEWYIMKEDISVGGDANLMSWRYAKGSSGYAAAWAARESQSYDTYDQTFK